jgi:hypothetical protein
LALIRHDVLNENEIREARINAILSEGRIIDIDGYDPDWIDPEFAIAYSAADLARAARDLDEARRCLQLLSYYLGAEPQRTDSAQESDENPTQAQIFEELNQSRLFREAWARKNRNQIDLRQRRTDSPEN